MYLKTRFYLLTAFVALVIATGHFLPVLYGVGRLFLLLLAVATVADVCLLFWRRWVDASRHCAERFSNGDDNTIVIRVENHAPFRLYMSVVDEIPVVFQRRDIDFRLNVKASSVKEISYTLCPLQRGEYGFGRIRVFISSVLGLAERRITCGAPVSVKVYPSYLSLRRYEFLAINNRLSESGIKRVRRPGNNTELEQIREYVDGDDFRTINWKASARRNQLMTNIYEEEKSQQLLCIIDKGRVMQQTFRGMTLLDYSINASLVLSYIAIFKEDKAGVASFSNRFESFVAPDKRSGQMQSIQEALYREESDFKETDFSALDSSLRRNLRKRSLLVLFTNFTGKSAAMRQLEYLRAINRQHRLVVVFFEDSEMEEYSLSKPRSTEDYYRHVICQKTIAEQRLIVSLLRENGILSLLTTPDRLSVDVINKYLETRNK